jgi:PPP family 3-phenylpropionic acid transporter
VTRKHASLPAEKIRARTVFSLSILSGVLFLPIGLHLPYFPVYLAARGLTQTEIAFVVGTPIFLRVVVIPIVAAIADRRGIAATLAGCTLAMLAGYCWLGLAEGTSAIFIAGVLAATAMGMLPSLTDALTLSQIRRADLVGFRPIAYSKIRVWTPVGVLAIMLLSGPIVEAFPGTRLVLVLTAMALVPVLAAFFAAMTIGGAESSAEYDCHPLAGPAPPRLGLVVIVAAALIQSSHAQIYTFGTLHWKASGYSPDFIGLAWAIGVGAETIFFLVAARFPKFEHYALGFLVLGAVGAALRWLAMTADPGPQALVALQAMHGLSFAATYFGSVLAVGNLAGPGHRARMQGRLAAASALSLGLATLLAGRLTDGFGEANYVFMALLAGAGLCLALYGGWCEWTKQPLADHSAAGRCSESAP